MIMFAILFFSALSGVVYSFNSSLIKSGLTVLSGNVIDVKWCSSFLSSEATKPVESIIILTDTGILYKSDNNGLQFYTLEKLLYGFGTEGKENRKAFGIPIGLFQSPNVSSVIAIRGSKSKSWFTENCGKDIETLSLEGKIDEFQFHPFKKNWILVSKTSEKRVSNSSFFKDLFLSVDNGKAWTRILENINQFSWACVSEKHSADVNESRILVTHEENPKPKENLDSLLNENLHVFFSDDFFRTKNKTVHSGNRFLISKSYVFVAKVIVALENEVSMHVSRHANTYKFREIVLPVKHKRDHSFTILDSSEDEVIIHVLHNKLVTSFGNAYISNINGVNYSKSLENVVRNSEGQCDFDRIEGLVGTFIANIYHPQYVASIEEQTRELRDKKNLSYEEKVKLKNHMKDLDTAKGTRISFDKGAMWNTLKAPDFDSQGKVVECKGDKDFCVLNLNSVSSSALFGPCKYEILKGNSNKNAVGMILGTGNVGTFVSKVDLYTNTYLSIDGGESWREILKGSHLYEIGDNGGIILAANDQDSSDQVLVSFTAGKSFYNVSLGQHLHVQMILSDPENTSSNFLLVGKTANGETAIVSLDVKADIRQCQGLDSPDSESSDYEIWTRGSGLRCFLGARYRFLRKKPFVECLNTQSFVPQLSVEPCECKEADWECEMGFERIDGQGPCMNLVSPKQQFEPPSHCEDYYFVSQGYRKVSGSLCEGGVSYYPLRMKCPVLRMKDRKLIAIGVIALLLVFGFVFGKFIWKFVRENVSNAFEKFLKKNDYKSLNEKGKKEEHEVNHSLFGE